MPPVYHHSPLLPCQHPLPDKQHQDQEEGREAGGGAEKIEKHLNRNTAAAVVRRAEFEDSLNKTFYIMKEDTRTTIASRYTVSFIP